MTRVGGSGAGVVKYHLDPSTTLRARTELPTTFHDGTSWLAAFDA
jgi:hypothetical protein